MVIITKTPTARCKLQPTLCKFAGKRDALLYPSLIPDKRLVMINVSAMDIRDATSYALGGITTPVILFTISLTVSFFPTPVLLSPG